MLLLTKISRKLPLIIKFRVSGTQALKHETTGKRIETTGKWAETTGKWAETTGKRVETGRTDW